MEERVVSHRLNEWKGAEKVESIWADITMQIINQREDNSNVTQSPWLQEVRGQGAEDKRITTEERKDLDAIAVTRTAPEPRVGTVRGYSWAHSLGGQRV